MKHAVKIPSNFVPEAKVLTEKTILITGANDGIGKALSLGLAEYGATVVLCGKNLQALEEVYDEIEARGGATPAIYPIDLATISDTEAKKMYEVLEKEFNTLDGIIHNAAILGNKAPISSYSEANWEMVLKVNLSAPFYISKALLPLLKKAKHASVIFTLDDLAYKGKAFWGAYSVAKAGLKNLCEVLADEYENDQTCFNTINPRATRTKLRQAAFPAENPNHLKPPEKLIKDYIFLLVEHKKKISGQHLVFSEN